MLPDSFHATFGLHGLDIAATGQNAIPLGLAAVMVLVIMLATRR